MASEVTPRPRISRRLGQLVFGSDPHARGPRHLGSILSEGQLDAMFERIAATYDLQNRLLSIGRDRHWRSVFARAVRPAPHGVVGDLAIGTADVAMELCRRYPSARVVGVDRSPAMLRIGRRKVSAHGLAGRIELREGDLRALPLDDGSLDAVTISFGIRNVEDRRRVLEECRRVLKPGAPLAIMEMSAPRPGIVGGIYRWYFDHVMPLLGNLFSRTDYAYDYLRLSIDAFPAAERFCQEMAAAGFERTSARAISFGTATIFRAVKPAGGVP